MVKTDNQKGAGAEDRKIIIAAGLTDPGKVRYHNEDAFSISEDLGLFIVSDGMGGHQAGEVASEIVVKSLPIQIATALSFTSNLNDNNLVAVLRQAIGELHSQIYKKAKEVIKIKDTGATIVACLIQGKVAAIAHLGDSRAYLMREGVLERLTDDHTIVGLLLQLGQITNKEAKTHPSRHILTRYVGMENYLEPDMQLLELNDGDRLLLCTDGLTNMVNENRIASILLRESDIKIVCENLVYAANEAGGKDNITVLVVQYGDWKQHPEKMKKRVAVKRAVGLPLKKKGEYKDNALSSKEISPQE